MALHRRKSPGQANPIPWRARRRPRHRRESPNGVTPTPCPIQARPHRRPRAPEPREPGPVVSLDPLAPVIVRSGRPFDGQSGPDPARFPPPSTVAGCLRTAWARATGRGFGPELAQMAVAGPLLLDRENRILVPKPADALYFGHGDEARCVRAEPRPFEPGCGADLPGALLPIQLAETVAGKPGSGPAWWSWGDLLAFRSATDAGAGASTPGCAGTAGHRRLEETAAPTWPSIRRTGAADSGRLFQTEGLDFDAPGHGAGSGFPRRGEALAGGAGRAAALGALRRGVGRGSGASGRGTTLGRSATGARTDLARAAAGLAGPDRPCRRPLPDAADAGHLLCRIPAGLARCGPDRQPARRAGAAAAASRGGGGSLAAALRLGPSPGAGPGRAASLPAPARRTGFRLIDGIAPDALAALWLASVSDGEQDRRDGFGLALPSPWEPFEPPAERTP